MLTKEQFCKFIKKYKELDDKEMRLNDALSDYFGEPITTYNNGLGLALDMLIDVMGDDTDLIVSFIYDANYGEREQDRTFVVKDKIFCIDSPEALYDVLTETADA